MKKFLLTLSTLSIFMLITACNNTSSSQSVSTPSIESSVETSVSSSVESSTESSVETSVSSSDESSSESVTSSSESSMTSSVESSVSSSVESSSEDSSPVVITPDLNAAIQALGNSFVIHYTNTQKESDSMIFCTGKSVFTQNDSSATEVSLDVDEWWVPVASDPNVLSQCTFGTYGENVWYLTYEILESYSDVASSVSSLDASLFEFDSEKNVFNSIPSANTFETVQMLASLNKKNDFLNLDFTNIAITLSEDNSIVKNIVINANNQNGDKEEVTISLEFSEYTGLPFSLSDETPIEAE